MNVTHLLLRQAAIRPEAPAIIEGSACHQQVITFAGLENQSAQGATLLVRSGVHAGDHVLVFIPMSIDLYVALIAIFRIGAVATFLDPSAGRPHIARCCAMLRPAAMIAVRRAHLLRLNTPALRKIPRQFATGSVGPFARNWRSLRKLSLAHDVIERSDDDDALVTFTSGSTGAPKAAVRSHGFLAAQHAALNTSIELAPGQIDLATLPIFSLVNLASGVTSVIPNVDLRKPGSVKTAPIVRQLSDHSVTRIVASPAFVERLLVSPAGRVVMQKLSRVYIGGAPVFPRLLQQLQAGMPAGRAIALYGSTEAEPIAHIAWDEISEADVAAMFAGRGLLAGLVVSEIQLRVICNSWGTPLPAISGEALDRLTTNANEPGEIVVSGRHVLRGYLNGAGDAETKFSVDGTVWHRTGDVGYQDEKRRLWLLGRASARIVDQKGTLYPFAVECAASQIVGVHRSALVQIAGRRVLAVEGVVESSELILDHLRWAMLDEVRRLKRIPVDNRHNAKIDYVQLIKRM